MRVIANQKVQPEKKPQIDQYAFGEMSVGHLIYRPEHGRPNLLLVLQEDSTKCQNQ